MRCSIQISRCRTFGLVQASRFGGSFPKAISRNRNPFKPDYSAMLPSFARPSKRPYFRSIHFRINYLQATTNGAVNALSHYRPNCREDQANVAADALPCHPPRKTFGASRSKPRFHFSEPHSFKPHPVGSLHFFDPDHAPPDPRLRNICPVLTTLVVRRVLKRASWRTYKDNSSGMKLSCRAIERRRSEPENQSQIIRTEHSGLEGWRAPMGAYIIMNFLTRLKSSKSS